MESVRWSAFHAASNALGLPAAEALIVGDNYRDDLLGGRGAGLSAITIRRAGASLSHSEPPGGEVATTTLADLEAYL